MKKTGFQNDALVSIIIPTYNDEDKIRYSVQSAINQSYSNIEIIIIDDGSDDNTSKICDEYTKKDTRISVVHKENGGLSHARNCGLDNASGDFIVFLDADDTINYRFVELLIDAIKKYDCDIAQCDFFSVRDHNDRDMEMNDTDISIYSGLEVVKQGFNDEYVTFNSPWNKVYKRELFNKTRFPYGKIREDEFTIWKILLCANKIAYIHAYGYQYMQSKNSIMGKHSVKKHVDGALAFYERGKYLKNNYFLEAAKEFMRMALSEIEKALYIGSIQEADTTNAEYVRKSIEKDFYVFLEVNQLNINSFPSGSRIVIYGAGIIGTSLYFQAEFSRHFSSVRWVDCYSLRKREEVESIDILLKVDYDYVIVAVKDDMRRNKIIKNLINIGVRRDLILSCVDVLVEQI